jgi:uncharacterized UBP type Zn finger protein
MDERGRGVLVLVAASGGPNGTAPRCDHLDAIRPVEPRSGVCPECQARGESWVGLVACLTCGWVACSDGSPNRHAKAHYEETDHPITGTLDSRLPRRWCYAHRRVV